ncbi:hypothetical protein EDB81DRAFT_80270 [Dactylonectria macrodidyma]|uniref:Cryptic loci regulator 2 N-terminal domain-containing protein n=1 Tax=Dactylonectria macrodidyma TaxID=307937 RepID=A0A9P9EG53_9HYPO|nr:hypothetical protein EDB81DRAFT_80270 [Dactylonectria macrodidyma]
MTEMKEFDVIRVARSDGSDTGPGYWPVTAPPATTTLTKKTAKDAALAEKAPRSKPQMVRLAEDDPRFVEWRVKLGILLKQELCPNPDEGSSWYVQFPRGYWLYEKSKHLWVSGYPIKAKLFKSPQEFAVHLIWLLSTSMDYKDCCCAHCNAGNIAKGAAATEETLIITHEAPKPEKPPPKVTPVPLPPIPGQPLLKQASAGARSASSQSTPVVTAQNSPAPAGPVPLPNVQPQPRPQSVPPIQPPIQPSPQPVPQAQAQPPPQLQPQSQAPPQLQPSPQPQPQPQPQIQPQPQPQLQPQLQPQTQVPPQSQVQIQPHQQQQTTPQPQAQPQPQPQVASWPLKSSLMFRAGELVWYQNGTTWRLGLIAASVNGNHEVMPIGHGLVQQMNVTKGDRDMRPFHAFTVPPIAIPDIKRKLFDEVPWEAMIRAPGNDGNKRELITLDASKMAAAKVDYSYSLWTQLSEDANAKTVTYYGCFFGAERIEIGDALRLRSLPAEFNVPAETGVLGLRFIFTTKDFPGSVFFRGHIYQPVSGDVDPPNVVSEDKLPVALRDESQWRNSTSPGLRWRWALVKENVVFKEQSIRGRFYPTHRLMPILNPEGFQQAVAEGKTDEQYAHLNNRMDGAGRYLGRKANRLDAVGASVPHTARFTLEPHVREEVVKDPGAQTEA